MNSLHRPTDKNTLYLFEVCILISFLATAQPPHQWLSSIMISFESHKLGSAVRNKNRKKFLRLKKSSNASTGPGFFLSVRFFNEGPRQQQGQLLHREDGNWFKDVFTVFRPRLIRSVDADADADSKTVFSRLKIGSCWSSQGRLEQKRHREESLTQNFNLWCFLLWTSD